MPRKEPIRRPCGCLASQAAHTPKCPLYQGHGGNRKGSPKGVRVSFVVDEALAKKWQDHKGNRSPSEAGTEILSTFFESHS